MGSHLGTCRMRVATIFLLCSVSFAGSSWLQRHWARASRASEPWSDGGTGGESKEQAHQLQPTLIRPLVSDRGIASRGLMMGLGKRGYASWHSSKVRGLEKMNKREDRSGPNTIGSRGLMMGMGKRQDQSGPTNIGSRGLMMGMGKRENYIGLNTISNKGLMMGKRTQADKTALD